MRSKKLNFSQIYKTLYEKKFYQSKTLVKKMKDY